MNEKPLWQLMLEAREGAGECEVLQVAEELRVVLMHLRGCGAPLTVLAHVTAEAYADAYEAAAITSDGDR